MLDLYTFVIIHPQGAWLCYTVKTNGVRLVVVSVFYDELFCKLPGNFQSMSEEKLNFEDLNLSIGQHVEVLIQSAEDKTFSRVMVLGAIPNESVIITADESGIVPPIEEGHDLVFRMSQPDGIAVFLGRVLYITEDPLYMAFIDIPTEVTFKRIRKAPRVFTSIPILVSNLDNPEYTGIAGRLKDISTVGACLDLYEPLGQVGDRVNIKGKFSVGTIKRVTSVRALIRSEKPLGNGLQYGVEFVEENENELITLFGFIFDAMSSGKIDNIR